MKQTKNVEKKLLENKKSSTKKRYYSSSAITKIVRKIRPFLLLSLIGHFLVLLIPLKTQNEFESKPQETLIEDKVKVTLIPAPQPEPKLTPSEPKTTQELPQEKPQKFPPPEEQIPNSPPPPSEPEIIIQEEEEVEIEPLEEPEPTTPEPEQPEKQQDIALPTSPFALFNFPTFQNAESGCYGSNACNQISGVQGVRNLSKSLQEHFEQNDYEVVPQDDYRDTGVEILSLAKNGETQYLSILDTGDIGEAIYVLAPTPITNLKKLENLQQARLEITSWLERFPNSQTIVEPSYFDQPGILFVENKLRSEIGANPLFFPGSQPEFLFINVLENQLVNNGFELTNLNNYGGGTMYELKRNGLIIGYFSLVPTRASLTPDKLGTVMIFWQIKPGS